MPLLGAHMSVAGGLHPAFAWIRQVEGKSLQIFTQKSSGRSPGCHASPCQMSRSFIIPRWTSG